MVQKVICDCSAGRKPHYRYVMQLPEQSTKTVRSTRRYTEPGVDEVDLVQGGLLGMEAEEKIGR